MVFVLNLSPILVQPPRPSGVLSLKCSLFLSPSESLRRSTSPMAFSLHSNLLSPSRTLKPQTKPPSTATFAAVTRIRCGSGSRSNRGPLVKGRILSTEAILAIQSLKRAYSSQMSSFQSQNMPNLSRLIKSDLLAVLRELLRQEKCALALHVLSTLRSEHNADLNLYADVINALARSGMGERIDQVVEELEREERGVRWESDKGLVRVVKGVVEAGRRESTVRICRMMRRCGCGDTWTADEYVVKALCRGLKSMGEVEMSDQVEREFQEVHRGG